MAHILYLILFRNFHPAMCPSSLFLKLKEEMDGKFLWYYSSPFNESIIRAQIGLWARFLQLLGLSLRYLWRIFPLLHLCCYFFAFPLSLFSFLLHFFFPIVLKKFPVGLYEDLVEGFFLSKMG